MLNWRLVGKKWAHWLHFFPDGVSYHEEPQDMFVPPPCVLTTLLTPKIVLATEDIVQSLKSVVLKLVLVCWAWKVEKVHLTLFLLIIHNKKESKITFSRWPHQALSYFPHIQIFIQFPSMFLLWLSMPLLQSCCALQIEEASEGACNKET